MQSYNFFFVFQKKAVILHTIYINIRMTYWEHDNNFDPKPHFMTDICYRKTGRYYDNDIWEETYEKCAEAAINYYYDYIEKKV